MENARRCPCCVHRYCARPLRGEPRLELELLAEIRSQTAVPLVLHGGSGLKEHDFRQAIARGITKVNFFTENSLAGVEAVRGTAQSGQASGLPGPDRLC